MSSFEKIFLIDDDPITNFINEDIIRELQLVHQIEVFTDAEKALVHLQTDTHAPDMIMLDLKMPGFDGFDFIQALQANRSQIRIIVLTSSQLSSDLDQLKALGVTSILDKPLTKEKMLRMV